jgi:hypothetical protein
MSSAIPFRLIGVGFALTNSLRLGPQGHMMRFSILRRLLSSFLLVACSAGVLCGQDRSQSPNDSEKIALHIDHIFHGGINRRGDIVGVHHQPSAPKQMRVDGKLCDLEIKQTSLGGEKDVVTAKIILRDPATGKVVREKFSTLFPSAWSKADIEQAIRAAYGYAKEHGNVDRDGGFHGRARGIKIDGYLTGRGDAIATAFPVFQAAQKKPRSKGTQRD